MSKKQGISIAIIIAVVLGVILAIKFVPVGVTILNLIMFSTGFASGFLFKKRI